MQHFVDDDAGYRQWLADNPAGFVINTTRRPAAGYLVLHRAGCRTISGRPARGVMFTGDYSKVCGDRAELEEFAAGLGGDARPCGLCLRLRKAAVAGGQVPGRFAVVDEVPGVFDASPHHGHVFISYVHEDSAAVAKLQQVLESSGVRVWRDTENLLPGQDWAAAIRRAITDGALVFVACFSHASVARVRTYQREELMLAASYLRQRRPDRPWLIPVRFDDCQIPDVDIGAGRTLASIQRADVFGAGCAEGYSRLVAAITQILGEQAGTAETGQARAALHADDVTSQDDWVGAVMAFADIDDPEFRRAVLRRMGDLLGLDHSFMASYRPVARDHIVDIVARCWDYRNRAAALAALATTLSTLRPDDRAAERIQQMPGAIR